MSYTSDKDVLYIRQRCPIHQTKMSYTSEKDVLYIRHRCPIHPTRMSFTSEKDVLYIRERCPIHPTKMSYTPDKDVLRIRQGCPILPTRMSKHLTKISCTSDKDVLYIRQGCPIHPTKMSYTSKFSHNGCSLSLAWVRYHLLNDIRPRNSDVIAIFSTRDLLPVLHRLRLDDNMKEQELELLMFVNQLSGPDIGLSACDIIVITRQTLLTVAGMLVTYFILMVQFRDSAETKLSLCMCSNSANRTWNKTG
ncbi:gustatory receptor for sugar taste 61a-like [Octopus vulgaris]|uniref:Gustatory receptor for sugar taste 61a-like n=1 Tax=Octopus vulgaris TaxID=6645 RepID=A0AA36FDP7_OCTVU|nr:gustatory receptor for sugar taste 61a-like [Octopus vulgaris]